MPVGLFARSDSWYIQVVILSLDSQEATHHWASCSACPGEWLLESPLEALKSCSAGGPVYRPTQAVLVTSHPGPDCSEATHMVNKEEGHVFLLGLPTHFSPTKEMVHS